MIKSPFKFLDSYTREDREIFFGREGCHYELHGSSFNSISPLQGLSVCFYIRWTASNADIFRAYSAEIKLQLRPERALYHTTGHRPVYQHNTNKKPCMGVIKMI